MNDSWGFNITDNECKSVRTLVGYLYRAAGNGANLLLNVGPRPDGTIGAEFTARLDSVGEWLRVYGPAIYGTRAGPVPPRSWGATTRRGDTVFVHVLDWPDPLLALPPLGARVRAAYLLRGRATVPVAETAAGVTLAVPPASAADPDRVVVVRTSASPTPNRHGPRWPSPRSPSPSPRRP